MKVAYQLRWLPTSAPATGLLLPGHRVEDVLRVCVELGVDPLPSIHLVADGFLLLLAKPSEKRIVGAIRLRGLSGHLLIPVNAELVPPLLPDESSALVRKRGLVFLPGGRVLEFDPEEPIASASLLRLGPARHRPWQAFPVAPMLAEGVSEITLAGIDTSVDQILQQGGEGIASEDPKLEGGSGLPSKIAANTLFHLGKGFAWLGKALNSPKIAGLGAKLLGGAMAMVPALSAKLMGAQEAMLRELLRQFREGNIEKALKHAMPLGGDPARGTAPAGNARLPTHNLFYSLLNLLGSAAGGPGSVWITADQTYYELLNEYRRQAELAVSRGDFRRAAFIHAKLLNDFHSAARILAQGGLHRDAAILYEKKLLNLLAAAKEWEAAGEIDRAIQLYRKMGDHATAGDLLRRIGEEDRAVQEYQIAAAKLEAGQKHYEAGELLRVRGQRPDLACAYYEKGWQLRPAGGPLPCATRLVQYHAGLGHADPFLALLTDAETYLVRHDPDTTATFFTEIARLAKTPPLAPIAEEIHDRALLGIARKMKQHLSTARAVNLLKNAHVWPVPLVGDSQYALSEATRRPMPARATCHTLQAGHSQVTAVCQMPLGQHVYLGYENGEVICFEPANNGVHLITRERGAILSLAVDPSKTYLVILSQQGPDKVCLRTVSRDLGYRMIAYTLQPVTGPARLALPALNSEAMYTLLYHGGHYRYFTLPNLVGLHSFHMNSAAEPFEVVVHGTSNARIASWWVLAIADSLVEVHLEKSVPLPAKRLGWQPAINADNTLVQIPLQVVQVGPEQLEISGLDERGALHRSALRLDHGAAEDTSYHPVGSKSYRAYAWVRADLAAAVHVEGIDWWTPGRMRPVQTKLKLRNPIAALPLPDARELLIVEHDGLLTRVPMAE